MTVQKGGVRGRGNRLIIFEPYISPEQKHTWLRNPSDFIPFAVILFVAAYDFVLYQLRATSLPLGLFGAVLVSFVIPSAMLLGASFYAMRRKPKASTALVIGGLAAATGFFLHIAFLAFLLMTPPA